MEWERGLDGEIQDVTGVPRRSHLPRFGGTGRIPRGGMPKLRPEE